MMNETFTLSNGVSIPKIGYGTWMIEDSKAAEAVKKKRLKSVIAILTLPKHIKMNVGLVKAFARLASIAKNYS